jgi:hemoglobin-like flavoprotein
VRALFPPEMGRQEQKFITMLAVIVEQLGDLDKMSSLLHEMGRRHVGYGTKSEYYATTGLALLWTISDFMGDAFTPDVEEAWFVAYHAIVEQMQIES